MHRLQAVARIRQGTVHDRGERVGEVALFQRGFQLNALDAVAGRRLEGLSHDGSNFTDSGGT